MRQKIAQLLANKGQAPVYAAIEKSIQDFKQMRYERGEIKETIRDIFYGLDGKIDAFIESKGY